MGHSFERKLFQRGVGEYSVLKEFPKGWGGGGGVKQIPRKWLILGGGGFLCDIPSVVRVWIFPGTTRFFIHNPLFSFSRLEISLDNIVTYCYIFFYIYKQSH